MGKIISLKEEFILREVFTREIIRKQFISDVTGIPMDEIKSVVLGSQFSRKRRKRLKQGIFDFVMTMNNEVKIEVELQIRYQSYWVKRNLFYLAHLYLDELLMGENYPKLKKCVSISILDFNLLTDREERHSVFTLRDDKGRELTDLFEVHVIELNKNTISGNAIDDWIRLFNVEALEDLSYFEDKSEGLREAAKTLKIASMTKNISWYIAQWEKARRDRWAEDEYVRDQGRAEGRAQGRAQALLDNVDSLQQNSGRSIEEACHMLGITMEEYAMAQKTVKDDKRKTTK